MRKAVVILLLVALPVLAGILGTLAGPLLARTHHKVQLADDVRLAKKGELAEPTDEFKSFELTGRRAGDVAAEAAAVEADFTVATGILGAWCGLVFALKIFGFHRTRRREIYEIDCDACVACARCFRYCPRERLRLRELAGAVDAETTTGETT